MPSIGEIMEYAAGLERSGSWEAARAEYGRLFDAAVRAGDLERAGDALRGQGRTVRELGRADEANELLELALEVAERAGMEHAAARALNLLAVARFLARDWEGARARYQLAMERARDAGDDVVLGQIIQNLGVVANILGELREARTLYLESIGSAVRSGYKLNEAMAYNNLGMVCTDLGEPLEAEIYFGRGIEICERLRNAPLLAKLYANRAEPLIRLGELRAARDTLEQAEQLARRVDDRGTLADAARFRGMIARAEGDLRGAARALARSLEVAGTAGLDLERAEALREMAGVHREGGHDAAAREALDEAHRLFIRLGALRDAAAVEEMGRHWSAGVAAA